MRKSILRNNTRNQRETGEAHNDSGFLRKTISNGFNRALAATKGFFRRLIHNADQTDAPGQANAMSSPFADTNLSPTPVSPLMNPRSGAVQYRQDVLRIAEVFGARNQCQDTQNNTVARFSGVRDIRPPGLRYRGLLARMGNSRFPGIKKRDKRRTEPAPWLTPRNEMKESCTMLSEVEKSGMHATQRASASRAADELFRFSPKPGQRFMAEDEDSNNSNAVRTAAAVREKMRKHVLHGRTYWRIYDREVIWPTRLGKREREVTFKGLREEPEHKIRKIAQFWVIRNADADGENNRGHGNERQRLVLDWDQYEFERNLWPRVCLKRERKMALENFLEEPKQKRRKIAEH